MATIISYPHQISVDQDGEVVAAIMSGSSVADVRNWNVLCTSPGESVQRARDGEGSVGVEGSFVFGQDSVVGDCSVDVATSTVLSSARNWPSP